MSERERERASEQACVCEGERASERERKSERERESERARERARARVQAKHGERKRRDGCTE